MKKLLIKFRIWLIKKLGGFTAQNYIDDTVPSGTYTNCSFEVKVDNRKPVHISYQTNVGCYGSSPEYREMLFDHVALELGKQILKKQLYTKLVSQSISYSGSVFRFDIEVLPPPCNYTKDNPQWF